MIKFQNLALRQGKQLLFESVNQDIHDGEKVGLAGDNGTGKSSLFQAILGEIHSDQGEIILPRDMRISHVAQETPNNAQSALEHVLDGDTVYRETEYALQKLNGEHTEQTAKLYTQMEDIDGYSARARGAKLLSGLGFKASEHGNETKSFSGGWRVRLNLAKALMAPSDLLLLDEPTNHLDLDAIVWLEEWLKKYPGTLIMVSHDRDFIDGCCRKIMHIENQQIRAYVGNYSQFERQRGERLANEQSMFEKQQRKIAHMENYIRRFRYKADKAKQAQSRIKALEKMQRIVPAHVGSPFNFKFLPCDRLSDPMLKLENVDAGYGDNVVLKEVTLSIAGGDRIGLLGANGAGKSTLIKIMAAELVALTGHRQETKHLNMGYFAQHQLEQLDAALTPMKQFQRLYPSVTTQQVRNFLGDFDFRGERVDQPIGPFSGGEKARLALALIIYNKPNLLLLDEPTNHLDMEMRHALTMAMQSYEGAIILVSHDRSLINSVTDRLILIRNGRVDEFKEDMDAYLRVLKQSHTDAPGDDEKARSESEPGMSKKQRRQYLAQRRNEVKPKRDAAKKLEKEMQKIQGEIDKLAVILNNPETYETESTANLAGMMQNKSDLDHQLKQTEASWYESAEELETLEQSLQQVTG